MAESRHIYRVCRRRITSGLLDFNRAACMLDEIETPAAASTAAQLCRDGDPL